MQYVVAGIASNGEAAVEMASDLSPDLILMDIDLGAGIDGIEAAARIRAQSEIPVVFLQDKTLSDCKQSIAGILPASVA